MVTRPEDPKEMDTNVHLGGKKRFKPDNEQTYIVNYLYVIVSQYNGHVRPHEDSHGPVKMFQTN